MLKRSIAGIILLASLIPSTAAFAQNVEMEAMVDRQEVALGGTVTLTVTATISGNITSASMSQPEGVCQNAWTGGGGCDLVVVGSRQSQSMSIRGNSSLTRITKTYQIQPQRAGSLTIGPVSLNLGGTAYSTEPIAVTVTGPAGIPVTPPSAAPSGTQPPVPAQAAPGTQAQTQPQQGMQAQGQSQQGMQAQGQPQQGMQAQGQAQTTPRAPQPASPTADNRARPDRNQPPQPVFPASVDPNLPFLAVTPWRSPVYVGEQFVLDYELFSSLFGNWELTGVRQPALEDFWFENVGLDRIGSYRPRQVDVGGIPFRSQLAARFVLVPLSVGAHAIAPLEAEASELFRGRLGGIRSEVTSVEVLPLPEGAPSGFSQSNVGEVNFTMNILEGGNRVGDPIRVRLRVEGTGLVSLFQLPVLDLPGARVHSPVEQRDLRLMPDNRIGGYHELEYVVIAIREGELVIPDITFHFFNPTTAQYQSITAEGRRIPIEGTNPNADIEALQAEEENSLFLAALPAPRAESTGRGFALAMPASAFWGAVTAPWGMVLVVMVVSSVRRRRDRSRPSRIRRTAARRALGAIRQASRKKPGEEALGEVASTLRQYLRERWDIKAGALTVQGTIEALGSKGISKNLAEEVCHILETSELARFNRDSVDRRTVQTITRQAMSSLRRMEASQ